MSDGVTPSTGFQTIVGLLKPNEKVQWFAEQKRAATLSHLVRIFALFAAITTATALLAIFFWKEAPEPCRYRANAICQSGKGLSVLLWLIVALEASSLAVIAKSLAKVLIRWQPLQYALTQDRLFIWRNGEVPKEISTARARRLTGTINYFGELNLRAPVSGRMITIARLFGLDAGEAFRARNLIERLERSKSDDDERE